MSTMRCSVPPFDGVSLGYASRLSPLLEIHNAHSIPKDYSKIVCNNKAYLTHCFPNLVTMALFFFFQGKPIIILVKHVGFPALPDFIGIAACPVPGHPEVSKPALAVPSGRPVMHNLARETEGEVRLEAVPWFKKKKKWWHREKFLLCFGWCCYLKNRTPLKVADYCNQQVTNLRSKAGGIEG